MMRRSEQGRTTFSWEWYRTLLAVLDEGSLSAAARRLDLTQPTVGRHISALESALSLVLFTRSHEGLRPTESALALRGHVEAMASLATSLQREAGRGASLSGSVRISASEVMAVEVLPVILAPLRQHYPHLQIELVASNRVQNLLSREADIAVRMVAPSQDAVIARRAGQLELGLYAHAQYLTRHASPTSLDELASLALIGYDEEPAYMRAYRDRFPVWQPQNFAFRSDSELAQLALLRAACGVGVCQVSLAQRDAALVRVLPEVCAAKLDVWVTMHEDLRRSPLCRTVFDGLVHGLAQYSGYASH